MAFTLVYSAEHYVIDLILGWGLAALVMVGCHYAERAWDKRKARRRQSESVTVSQPDQAAREGAPAGLVADGEADPVR
jgi:hypothetical protein